MFVSIKALHGLQALPWRIHLLYHVDTFIRRSIFLYLHSSNILGKFDEIIFTYLIK